MRRPVFQVARWPRRRAPRALLLAALRYCRKAATALSTTFTSTSPVLSSASTLRWMKDALAHAAGQLEFEVGQTRRQPMLRQKRTTVGLLTGARCQLAHRQTGEGARVVQHELGHALLGGGQGRQGGGDADPAWNGRVGGWCLAM